VGLSSGVGVNVAVAVGVGLNVAVAVGVNVAVGVAVDEAVGVAVGVGVGVGVGFTVNVALLLVTLPKRLLTVTAKSAPLSSAVVGGVVYDALVPPAMFTPFFLH
jgi:hypothetical protein